MSSDASRRWQVPRADRCGAMGRNEQAGFAVLRRACLRRGCVLGMKTYDARYVASCRETIDRNVRLYDTHAGLSPDTQFDAAFFNTQLMLLDYMFVHRLSGIEGKDGNPLNEVRILCNSLLLNGGKLQIDRLPGWPNSAVSGLKLPVDGSILNLPAGANVQLTRQAFERLSKAFFREIQKRYSSDAESLPASA